MSDSGGDDSSALREAVRLADAMPTMMGQQQAATWAAIAQARALERIATALESMR